MNDQSLLDQFAEGSCEEYRWRTDSDAETDVFFKNLMSELFPNEERVSCSAPVKLKSDSSILTNSSSVMVSIDSCIYESFSKLRSQLFSEPTRVLNRSKLAAEVVSTVASAISSAIIFSKFGYVDNAEDLTFVRALLLHAWPIIDLEYTREVGTFGLASLVKRMPMDVALVIGECILDQCLEQDPLLQEINKASRTILDMLFLRFDSERDSQSTVDSEHLTDRIKELIRRDWFMLQYTAAFYLRDKASENLNNLHVTSKSLWGFVKNGYIAYFPHLKYANVLKESVLSCMGKLTPAEALINDILKSIELSGNKEEIGGTEILASQIDKAAAIFDNCHDYSALLAAIRLQCVVGVPDANVPSEARLFDLYLGMCCKPGLPQFLWIKWLGSLDRVFFLIQRHVQLNEHDELRSVAPVGEKLLKRIDCCYLKGVFIEHGGELDTQQYFRLFRRVSYLITLLSHTDTAIDSCMSSLYSLCLHVLDSLLVLPNGSFNELNMEKPLQWSIGVCIFHWKKIMNGKNDIEWNKKVVHELSGVLKSSILSSVLTEHGDYANFLLRLFSWLLGQGNSLVSSNFEGDMLWKVLNTLHNFLSYLELLGENFLPHNIGGGLGDVKVHVYVLRVLITDLLYSLMNLESEIALMPAMMLSYLAGLKDIAVSSCTDIGHGIYYERAVKCLMAIIFSSQQCQELIGENIICTALELVNQRNRFNPSEIFVDDNLEGSLLRSASEVFILLCYFMYALPITLETNELNSAASFSSLESLGLTVPDPLVPGIYMFLKFWDDYFVTLNKSDWKSCLSILYKSPVLARPSDSRLSTLVLDYIFGIRSTPNKLIFEGDMVSIAANMHKGMVDVVAEQKKLVGRNSPSGNVNLWLWREFYSTLLANGGFGWCHTNSCGPECTRVLSEKSCLIEAKQNSKLPESPAKEVDYYFHFLCEAEKRVCPIISLALQCVCYSDSIESQLGTWVNKIASGLHDLANAAFDEMTSYVFPIETVSSTYMKAEVFCDEEIPHINLSNIFKGLFLLVPIGMGPSILTAVQGGCRSTLGEKQFTDSCIASQYQIIEEKLLRNSSPAPISGISYESAIHFLCRYHKSVCYLLDKVHALVLSIYFPKYVLCSDGSNSTEKCNELLSKITGCAALQTSEMSNAEEFATIDTDLNGIGKDSMVKTFLSLTEIKVLSEYNRAALVYGEKKHEEFLKRGLMFALQGANRLNISCHYPLQCIYFRGDSLPFI